MRNLTATICLTLVVLLFSPAEGWSANFQKGFDAFERGDYATALREWKPLAEQGHALAQISLGTMYYHGRGVPQDYKTAVKWFRLAAEQGNAKAQHNLGLVYYNGDGVPQDYKTSVKWYRLAAGQGNAGRNGGEYYTPRPLIRAMVRVVKPEIGNTIYDGAVGSAGFLCEANDYMRDVTDF